MVVVRDQDLESQSVDSWGPLIAKTLPRPKSCPSSWIVSEKRKDSVGSHRRGVVFAGHTDMASGVTWQHDVDVATRCCSFVVRRCCLQKAVSESSCSLPTKLAEDTLAFMFETSFTPHVTKHAMESEQLDKDYYKCWVGLRPHFDRNNIRPSVV